MTTDLPNLPPEWAPQERLLIGWPSHFDPWGEPFQNAREEIAGFANLIVETPCQTALSPTGVTLVVDGVEADRAARQAVPGADIINTACGDTWLRDTSAIFARDAAGGLVGRSFQFNGWGEKYIYPGDADLSDRLCDALDAKRADYPFVLEGGSVDWDGAGLLLTTDECLLNPNRNPSWSRRQAEAALCEAFNAAEIIWTAEGLLNDHTDGHIDNLARFVGAGHVLCQSSNGTDDPHTDRLLKIRETLENWRGKSGQKLTVSTMPSPGRVQDEQGDIMPASHMNFVITNQTVIIPAYNDEVIKAVRVLEGLFPDRKVVASSANAVLTGGGAFHCISQQIPA